MSVAERHRAEVKRGLRFQFGKNWTRFLTTLNEQKIVLAEHSLLRALPGSRFDGNTFLDVGSGSGLFSLAARRLGAKVYSFDYDANSVACTNVNSSTAFSPTTKTGPSSRVRSSIVPTSASSAPSTSSILGGVLHHTAQM